MFWIPDGRDWGSILIGFLLYSHFLPTFPERAAIKEAAERKELKDKEKKMEKKKTKKRTGPALTRIELWVEI